MNATTLDSILAAINDPSNYDEQSLASITLTSVELPNLDDLDTATYEYLLEWA